MFEGYFLSPTLEFYAPKTHTAAAGDASVVSSTVRRTGLRPSALGEDRDSAESHLGGAANLYPGLNGFRGRKRESQ